MNACEKNCFIFRLWWKHFYY